MPDEHMTIPPVDRVEVFNVRPSKPTDPAPAGGTVMAIFDCRVGPFDIDGVRLIRMPDSSVRVFLPRCSQTGSRITLTDPDIRRALKAAARRALKPRHEDGASDAHP